MASIEDILLEEEFSQRPMTGSLFMRLAQFMRPHKWKLIGNLAATALAIVSELLGPKFIQIGIDRYLTNFKAPRLAARGILVVSAIYLGNLLIGWLLSIAQVRSAIAAGQSAVNDLRESIFAHIQRLSLSYFDKTHQGRIIARADTDLSALDEIMTWGANQFLASTLTLAGVVILMLQYDWRLCLAVSLVLPALGYSTHLFQKRGMRAYRAIRQQASRLTASLAENISGVRLVQALAREDYNLQRFEELHETYRHRALAGARIFHTYMPFINLTSGAGIAIILGYGGTLALRGEITAGELAAFVIYVGMFFGPIQTMGELYNQVLSSAAGAERIFVLLDTEPEVRNHADAKPLPPVSGHVVFEHVCFRYETTPLDRWILEDISFEAKPGETIALVGATGSGKTSIISLLARFYEPHRGRITVDGIELRDATIDSLHEQIGIVTQENFLFTGTVMDNLRFGRIDATDEEVREAARTLGTDEMILKFPNGYETKVSERGGNFSAGERQLICFTRAMVARPRMLILDEATSAVDPQTETVIQHALETLFSKRTSLVIAHRLSTVRRAQQILVLSHGKIIERGTHDDLMQLGCEYRRLYEEFTRH
jgi:ABC-type multidrug transport system fused ATPase/permease subunit